MTSLEYEDVGKLDWVITEFHLEQFPTLVFSITIYSKDEIKVTFRDEIVKLPFLVYSSKNQKYAILLKEEAVICR